MFTKRIFKPRHPRPSKTCLPLVWTRPGKRPTFLALLSILSWTSWACREEYDILFFCNMISRPLRHFLRRISKTRSPRRGARNIRIRSLFWKPNMTPLRCYKETCMSINGSCTRIWKGQKAYRNLADLKINSRLLKYAATRRGKLTTIFGRESPLLSRKLIHRHRTSLRR